jgi:hypothetical protein
MLSVALEGRFDFPVYLDIPGGQVSTSLYLGSALGCYHIWWVTGCVLFGAGGLRGSGHGLADAQSHTAPYLTSGLRAGIDLPLASVLALRVYGDLLGRLSQVTLNSSDAEGTELWRAPAVTGAVGFGITGRIR